MCVSVPVCVCLCVCVCVCVCVLVFWGGREIRVHLVDETFMWFLIE